MKAREVAEWIARDASCAQGEFHARVNSMLPYLTDFADEIVRLRTLVRMAYNEGFTEGMREESSRRGGKPWEDSTSHKRLAHEQTQEK